MKITHGTWENYKTLDKRNFLTLKYTTATEPISQIKPNTTQHLRSIRNYANWHKQNMIETMQKTQPMRQK